MHGPERIPCVLRRRKIDPTSTSTSTGRSNASSTSTGRSNTSSTSAGRSNTTASTSTSDGGSYYELDVLGAARPGAPGQLAALYK